MSDRSPGDFYRTPPPAVWALLHELEWAPPRVAWLDLGAGDGAISAVLREAWPEARAVLVERDQQRAAQAAERVGGRFSLLVADYRLAAIPPADVAVLNPPYAVDGEPGNDAAAAIRVALDRCQRVAALVRLQWTEGKGVRDLVHRLSDVILVGRLKFQGERGGTDRWASAWCVWDEERRRARGNETRFRVVDLPSSRDLAAPNLVHDLVEAGDRARCGRPRAGLRLKGPGLRCLGCVTAARGAA